MKSEQFKNGFLVLSVLVVAAAALGYELAQAALATNLQGNSVMAYSAVIGAHLSAMGVGSYLAKFIKDEDLVDRFIQIELLLALLGGGSSLFLSFIYPVFPTSFMSALVATVFIIGCFIGMEVPLAMRILSKKQVTMSDAISRILSVDYLGAVVISLLFPLVLMPKIGSVGSAVLFGCINLVVAIGTMFVLKGKPAKKMLLQAVGTGAVLTYLFFNAAALEQISLNHAFEHPIVMQKKTKYQQLKVTQKGENVSLFINGNLQFSSRDEVRYHESLVMPVAGQVGFAKKALVLGGGDGMAVRELLKYENIEEILLVDLDPEMTAMFKDLEALAKLNNYAFRNEKVTVINDDAFSWIQRNEEFFDIIVVDFPDPSSDALGKLYSVEFYKMAKRALSQQGMMVVQSTSPYNAPMSFGTIGASLREAGFQTLPYYVLVPSFGPWGFHLAGHKKPSNELTIPEGVTPEWITKTQWSFMLDFPKDMKYREDQSPSYFGQNQIVFRFYHEWSKL